MQAFLLLFLVCSLAACLNIDPKAKMWSQFKTLHKKTYHSEEEEKYRFNLWSENLEFIERHNRLYEEGAVSYFLGQNHFSDMTKEERKNFRGLPPRELLSNASTFELPDIQINKSFDWRDTGAVTPAKQQGRCEAGWIFAAVAAIEAEVFKKYQILVSLSEQQLVDCIPGISCETHSWVPIAFEYLKSHGLELDKDYPYVGEIQKCQFKQRKTVVGEISGFKILSPMGDEDALTKAVFFTGPMPVTIDAIDDLYFYKGGVYKSFLCNNSPSSANHAVVVVGFSSTDRGEDYYIVKNSWGHYWGEEGFMRIARNAKNMCGIANFAAYPEL